MIRYLKAMWRYAKYQAWVDCPEWRESDSVGFKKFLAGEVGARFRATMLNAVLRQQASAVSSENNVDRSIGYANGFRGCVSFIESLAESSEEDEQQEFHQSDKRGLGGLMSKESSS